MDFEYQAYLAHHGVKGQKWGVRRYQNEDGSLTAQGRTHYDIGYGIRNAKQKAKSATSKLLPQKKPAVKKSKPALTEEQKQARKNKVKKILGIAAGVTIAAAAAYATHKGLEKADAQYREALYRGSDPNKTLRNFDKNLSKESGMAYMLPKGGKIQRIGRYDESGASGHAYVTFDPEDNERYRGFFGKISWGSKIAEDAIGKHTNVYVHELTAKENLISPDKRTRIQTFMEMHHDNPVEVGKTLGNYHTKERGNQGHLPAAVYRKQYAKMGGNKLVTKGYQTFVKAIGDHNNDTLRSEYFRRLQAKGFNMIQDDQDSGKNGIRPSIIFDREKSTEYNGHRDLPYHEVKEQLRKYGRFVAKDKRHREWEA